MCVCVCVWSVCYHASEGIARFYSKTKTRSVLVEAFLGFKLVDLKKNLPFKSYGVKNQYAMEYLLTTDSFGTDAVTFRQNI